MRHAAHSSESLVKTRICRLSMTSLITSRSSKRTSSVTGRNACWFTARVRLVPFPGSRFSFREAWGRPGAEPVGGKERCHGKGNSKGVGVSRYHGSVVDSRRPYGGEAGSLQGH